MPSTCRRRGFPDRVAAEPDAVDEIVTACARLPLALAVAATRAVLRPRLSLVRLVELSDRYNEADRRGESRRLNEAAGNHAEASVRASGRPAGPAPIAG